MLAMALSLEIINGLWTRDTYAYDGRCFTIPEIRLAPRPVQTPRPPILGRGGPGAVGHEPARHEQQRVHGAVAATCRANPTNLPL